MLHLFSTPAAPWCARVASSPTFDAVGTRGGARVAAYVVAEKES
jgi:hypothetical protein